MNTRPRSFREFPHTSAVSRNLPPVHSMRSEAFLMPVIMDADRMGRTLTRIAHEILERNRGMERLALVGIRTRGDVLAKRLAKVLEQITNEPLRTGALDITLYRDDVMRHAVGPQPLVRRTEIPFSIDDQKFCWWTTCCTPGGRSARLSMR